jgi:hypothetical protein
LSELVRRGGAEIASVIGTSWELEAAWPVPLREGTNIQHGPGIAVHLALSPSPTAARLVLWLETPLAVYLVERVLGGAAGHGAAHQALNLRPGEQGVLAYSAAKVARAFHELRVTEVSTEFPACLPGVLVPLSIAIGPVRSVVYTAWFDGDGERSAKWVYANLHVWLSEHLDDAELSALGSGDLLCFQPPALHYRDARLWGLARASFEGSERFEYASLEGDRIVRKHAPARRGAEGQIHIELTRQRVSVQELALFHGGQPLTLEGLPTHVTLSKNGVRFAEGELVLYRGQSAIRISAR